MKLDEDEWKYGEKDRQFIYDSFVLSNEEEGLPTKMATTSKWFVFLLTIYINNYIGIIVT